MPRDTQAIKIRPWAGNVAANRIDPDDASLTPTIVRSAGWPPSFSTTHVPRRRTINQMFCEVTSMLDEINKLGILEHDTSLAYLEHAIVNYDGVLYRSTRAVPAGNQNGPGGTNSSTYWEILTAGITVAGTPSSVAAAAGNGQATVTWIAPQDGGSAITTYQVQYRLDGGSFSQSQQVNVNGIVAVVTGLSNGSLYQFRVRAVTLAGNGSWSSTASATPQAETPSPPNLSVSPADGAINANWNDPDDGGAAVTGFRLEWDSNSNFTSPASANLGSTLNAHSVTGLSNGFTYYLRIRAVNSRGNGDWSATVTAMPEEAVPGVPSVPPTPTATAWNAQVTLSWNAPADNGSPITGYTYQWRESGTSFSTQNQGTTNDNRVVIGSLTNAQSYDFRVRAMSSTGNSPWSNTASATPNPRPPDAVTSLVALKRHASALIRFSAPGTNGAAVTNYTYQWRNVDINQGWSSSRQSVTTSREFIHSTLTNGVNYAFRVRANSSVGNSDWSGEATVTPEAISVTQYSTPGDHTHTWDTGYTAALCTIRSAGGGGGGGAGGQGWQGGSGGAATDGVAGTDGGDGGNSSVENDGVTHMVEGGHGGMGGGAGSGGVGGMGGTGGEGPDGSNGITGQNTLGSSFSFGGSGGTAGDFSAGTGGSGGRSGMTGNPSVRSRGGGGGGGGEGGSTIIATVLDLVPGDTIDITVGAGGARGTGGAGGVGDSGSLSGAGGGNASAGVNGLVTVTPIT